VKAKKTSGVIRSVLLVKIPPEILRMSSCYSLVIQGFAPYQLRYLKLIHDFQISSRQERYKRKGKCYKVFCIFD